MRFFKADDILILVVMGLIYVVALKLQGVW